MLRSLESTPTACKAQLYLMLREIASAIRKDDRLALPIPCSVGFSQYIGVIAQSNISKLGRAEHYSTL